METKIEAMNRLQAKFTDRFGRITLLTPEHQNPDIGYYPTQNYNLWTGEVNLLMNDALVPKDIITIQKENFLKSYKAVEIVPGLITRSPDPYRTSQYYDPISLDEYHGALFSAAVFDLHGDLGDKMVEYGKNHGWAYIDDKPGANPFKTIKSDIKGFFKTLYDVLKFAIKTKDLTGSNDMDKIIEQNRGVVELSRVRLPKDVLIIKAASKSYKPTLLELLHFFFANESTIKESNDETSGKILSFFKFKLLKIVGYEPFLVKLAHKRFKRKMRAKYGHIYMEELFRKYYEGYNGHPLHTLIKGMSEV